MPVRSRHLAALLVLGLFVAVLPAAPLGDQPTPAAVSQPEPPPPPRPPSNTTYPQIVRIRYLEGDVRVARGAQNDKDDQATGDAWEQAVADLPLETGFSLATGAGRAEIEFEDASTLYLADNSVLTFDDLHTTRGIPHTEMTLLAGSAAVHFYPIFMGESFLLRTPTDSISTTYPEKSYARIDSYLDAVAVTPLVNLAPEKHLTVQVSGSATRNAAKGQTVFYNNGAPVAPPLAVDPTAFAQWDKWVAGRVVSRADAMALVAKASGLATSMPGLGDMNAQGIFFPCAPYGTCWMPNVADPQQTADALPPSQGQPVSAPDFTLALNRTSVSVMPGGRIKVSLSVTAISGFAGNVALASTLPAGFSCVTICSGPLPIATLFPVELVVAPSVPPGDYTVLLTADSGTIEHQATLIVHVLAEPVEFDVPATASYFPYFPCAPSGVHAVTYRDRLARPHIVNLSLSASGLPYSWAVCHAGTWIYRQHGYIWVAGTKRHHHPPVCWIKRGRHIGYVPRHPRDQPGEPPHNRMHEVYMAGDKKNASFEATELPPNSKIETLLEPPKDFRTLERPPLERVGEPTLVAHRLKDGLAPGQSGQALRFDTKKQSFLLVSHGMDGAKITTTAISFPVHGSSLHTTHGGVEPHNSNTRAAAAPHPASSSPSSGSHPSPPSHAPATPHTSAPAPHSAPTPHSAPASHPAAAPHPTTTSSHTGVHH